MSVVAIVSTQAGQPAETGSSLQDIQATSRFPVPGQRPTLLSLRAGHGFLFFPSRCLWLSPMGSLLFFYSFYFWSHSFYKPIEQSLIIGTYLYSQNFLTSELKKIFSNCITKVIISTNFLYSFKKGLVKTIQKIPTLVSIGVPVRLVPVRENPLYLGSCPLPSQRDRFFYSSENGGF